MSEFVSYLETASKTESRVLIETLFYNFLLPDAYTYVFVKKSYSESEHEDLIEEILYDLFDDEIEDFTESFSKVKNMLEEVNIHHIYLHKQYPSKLIGGADEYYTNLQFAIKKISEKFGEELSNHRLEKIKSLSENDKDLITEVLPLILNIEVDYGYKLLNTRSISRYDIDELNDTFDDSEEPINFDEVFQVLKNVGLALKFPKRFKDHGKYFTFSMAALNVILETNYGNNLIDAILSEEDGSKIFTSEPRVIGIKSISRAEQKFIRNTILDFGSKELSLRTFSFPHLSTKDIIDIIRKEPEYFRWILENPDEVGTKDLLIKLRTIGYLRSIGRIWGGRLLFSTAFVSIVLNLISRQIKI